MKKERRKARWKRKEKGRKKEGSRRVRSTRGNTKVVRKRRERANSC